MKNQASASAPEVRCSASAGLVQWLSDVGGSLLITTYQANLVALAGLDGPEMQLLMRRFDKPMGAAVSGDQIAIANRDSVVLMANSAQQAHEYPLEDPQGYDALFLPRARYFTCPLQIHDIAFGQDDELWLVNTRFSCLATLSRQYSFEPRWQPPFIDELVPEDRCHLNGLAMVDRQPKFVTALGATNEPEGWRGKKAGGGVVIDVDSGESVVSGLSMPHSPRWHDGMLWFLNSGRGELCALPPGGHQPTVVCNLPGYARGLSFVGNHALIGLSKIRERHTFGGMPIGEDNSKLRCAVAVVDLTTSKMTGMLDFTSGVEELYEVQFLPGVRKGRLCNLDDEDANHAISAPGFAYWMFQKRHQS